MAIFTPGIQPIHTNQKDAPVKIEQVHEHIDLHSDSFGSNHSVKDRDPRSRHNRQSFPDVKSWPAITYKRPYKWNETIWRCNSCALHAETRCQTRNQSPKFGLRTALYGETDIFIHLFIFIHLKLFVTDRNSRKVHFDPFQNWSSKIWWIKVRFFEKSCIGSKRRVSWFPTLRIRKWIKVSAHHGPCWFKTSKIDIELRKGRKTRKSTRVMKRKWKWKKRKITIMNKIIWLVQLDSHRYFLDYMIRKISQVSYFTVINSGYQIFDPDSEFDILWNYSEIKYPQSTIIAFRISFSNLFSCQTADIFGKDVNKTIWRRESSEKWYVSLLNVVWFRKLLVVYSQSQTDWLKRTVSGGTKYARNIGHKGDQACLERWWH